MNEVATRHCQALLLGLQFLTTLPVPKDIATTEQLQGLSLLWYPAIGLFLGLALTFSYSILPLPYYLQAMLIVTLWVVLTGALHLDGLADCADAWMGGLGDRERTLVLLKDPLCGSMAVIALMTILTLKGLALAALIQNGAIAWLWTVPLLARASLLLLFLSTDYVRPQGLGEILAQHFSRVWAKRVLILLAVVLFVLLPFEQWLFQLMVVVGIFLWLRRAAIRRLGGFTGDVAGAQVELVEVGLLLTLACQVA